jgi:hypothetical protein
MTNKLLSLGVVAALSIGLSAEVRSATLHQLNFGTFAPSSAVGGNIQTATSFTVGGVTSTFGSGVFSSFPPLTNIGNLSFTVGDDTSLDITNPTFGDFTSTSVQSVVSAPPNRLIVARGNWTPGSGVTGGAHLETGDFDFFLTQHSPWGTISATASFLATPEPATLGLMALGLFGAGFAGRRRRN